MNTNKGLLTEEDRKLLRQRFENLQKDQSSKLNIVSQEEGIKGKVLKAAQARLNGGESLDSIFEYCFEAGLKAASLA